jgi:hypothetical protein
MGRLIGRGLAGVAASLLCAVAAPAVAQSGRIDALSLEAGARARILGPSADSKYMVIKVASTSRDSLRYSLDRSPDVKSVAWDRVSRMDASMGRHGNGWRDAGIGLLAGAAVGALLGAQDKTELRGVVTVGSGVVLGFLGGIVGGVIGIANRTENWVPVTIPHTPIASIPRSGPAVRTEPNPAASGQS